MLAALIAVLIAMFTPPLSPHPVDVPFDGDWAWAYLDRRDGWATGSANRDTAVFTVESLIKPWIGADYLRRTADPPQWRLDELTRMIVDSDDNAAEDIYRLGGADAVTARMGATCGLTSVGVRAYWWSYTTMTAADATRLGACLADGRAAGRHTGWLLDQMRQVRGDVTRQGATTGGGRWGIIDGLPSLAARVTAIKNGWTAHGDGWHVNCLAIHPAFVLSIMARYPYRRGLAYGAQHCAQITRALIRKPQPREVAMTLPASLQRRHARTRSRPAVLDDEYLYTPAEVAELFGVNVKSVTRWARNGHLPSVCTLGGHRRYRAADVREVYEAGGGVWRG